MSNNNLQITLLVDQSPREVFDAVCAVTEWWTENLTGKSKALNDEFSVQFWDLHFSKQRVTELVPEKKVVWAVTESELTFLKQRDEWTGTTIVFEISRQADKTRLLFTHIGLTPQVECFNDCRKGWAQYVGASLLKRITTGQGQPERKETAEA